MTDPPFYFVGSWGRQINHGLDQKLPKEYGIDPETMAEFHRSRLELNYWSSDQTYELACLPIASKAPLLWKSRTPVT